MQNHSYLVFFVFFGILSINCSILVFANGIYVPYVYKWGIYEFDPESGTVVLIYTTPDKISNVRLNPNGTVLVFSQKFGGDDYEHEEICTIYVDGSDFTRLTENMEWDIYPVWSSDGTEILFLVMNKTLDIYIMNYDGSNRTLLYDSGYHDSDPHMSGNNIVFTQEHQIWLMKSDGTEAHNITDPPRAGEWGNAVLPFGDYDPRISPDGSNVVFERMVDDSSPHGNYDIFMVDIDGGNIRNITCNGWTQGMAVWSSTGNSLVYSVTAIGETGIYDIFTINPNGTGIKNLTSELLPSTFLCHSPIFSADDANIIFIGEWWDWKILDTTISCTMRFKDEDKRIVIDGKITPTNVGAEVEIKIVKPDSTIETVTAITNLEGKFCVSYTASENGEYTFSASWNGDPGHKSSKSTDTRLIVEEPKKQISGFPVESLILALIICLLILRSITK